MKKLTILGLCLIAMLSTASAQPFHVKTNVIGIGVGFGSALGSFSTTAQSPAISALYERGVWNVRKVDVISLGGYIGHKSFKNDYNGFYGYKQKWDYTSIGFRSAYHYNGFTNLPKLDIYGGIMISYDIVNYTYKDNDPNQNSPFYNTKYGSSASASAFVGGRYFFTEGFGAYSELGYGVSFFTIGLCFKF